MKWRSTPCSDMNKEHLINTLHIERAQWDEVLAAIPPERLTQPGLDGGWSVRDVIAHVTVYEQWLVGWLQAALRGEFPALSVLDTPGLDERNRKASEATRTLSLAEVQAEAERNFQSLLTVLEQFSEEDFVEPSRTEWFMKPYWSQKDTISEAVLNFTVEHYAEHRPNLPTFVNDL